MNYRIMVERYRSLLIVMSAVFCSLSVTAPLDAQPNYVLGSPSPIRLLLPGYERFNVVPGQPTINAKPADILPGWYNPQSNAVALPNPSGLKLEIGLIWPQYTGYLPIPLTFYQSARSTEDRVVNVQLRFVRKEYRSESELIAASGDLLLPADLPKVRHWLYVPWNEQLHQAQIQITVSEAGRILEDISTKGISGSNVIGFPQSNTNINRSLTLSLQKKKNSPQTVFLSTVWHDGVGNAPNPVDTVFEDYHERSTYQYPVKIGVFELSGYGDLPDHWLGYTMFENVLLERDKIAEFAKTFPVQWRALLDWVAAGGRLVLIDDRLRPEKSKAADFADIDRILDQRTNGTGKPGWYRGLVDRSVRPIPGDQEISPEFQNDDNVAPAVIRQQALDESKIIYGRGRDSMMRSLLTGEVLVATESSLERELTVSDSMNATSDILRVPAPEVGLPPLGVFQLLITAFVVLFGPVNYWYCKKNKKLQLLLITVPLGAVGITGLLVFYSLFKDGVTLRTWDHSVIVIDQPRQQAVIDTQRQLFAGMTPGGGLNFSTDTCLTFLADPAVQQYGSWSYQYERQSFNRDYRWQSEGVPPQVAQQLSAGWIAPRELRFLRQTQLTDCKSGLQISQADGKWQVANRLGSDVVALYVWNEQGPLGQCNELAAGQSVSLDNPQPLSTGMAEHLRFATLPRLFTKPNTGINSIVQPKPPRRMYLALIKRWPDLDPGLSNRVVEQIDQPDIVVGYW